MMQYNLVDFKKLTLGDALTFNEMHLVKDFISFIDENSPIKKAGFNITDKSPIPEVILYFKTVSEMLKRSDKDKKLGGYIEFVNNYIHRFNYIINLHQQSKYESSKHKLILQ